MGAAFSQFLGQQNAAPPALPPTPADPLRRAGLQGISKKAQKKAAREKRLQERKLARKAARRADQERKKAERRAEREEMLRNLPAAERDKVVRERVETFRAGRAEERRKRAELREALQKKTRYHVCIDLGWNKEMFEKERKSLARQLAYSYSAMRKCAESGGVPLALGLAGVDDVIRSALDTTAKGWEGWPVERYDNVGELGQRVVYLTHDAEEVLEELDEETVYVIGGLVDRNRLKGCTREKARQLGVRMARLNLDEFITLGHGTPVLTVNHCVEILLYKANGLGWKEAYMKVLPMRKGVSVAES